MQICDRRFRIRKYKLVSISKVVMTSKWTVEIDRSLQVPIKMIALARGMTVSDLIGVALRTMAEKEGVAVGGQRGD